jgi:hypothetical protein
MRSSERIEELSEDIDVAIREFLERHPHTNPHQIRRAMLVVGRDACGAGRRAPRVLGLVIAFLLGVGLGAAIL